MKTGKIIRRIAILLSVLLLITSSIGTTYCFIVTKTDSIINVFLPEEADASGLTIRKTVEHPLGDGYAIPDNIIFDFSVELGSYYAGAKLNTTVGEMTANENGVLNVSIKPGVVFGIEGIEEGTVVKVTEQATALKGFSIKGDDVKYVTVGADGSAEVEFINVYTPEPVKPHNVTIGGVKVLEGRDWQEGDSFSFVLEQKNGDGWTSLGEQTVNYHAENADFDKFSFNDIFHALTFDKVGEYVFRMSEVMGELDNMDYDKTVNHFIVLVTDADMDGTLEINTVSGTENAVVSIVDGGFDVSVGFNNTFVPPVIIDPNPITVEINVEKVVNNIGELTYGKGGFSFVLKNLATGEGLESVSADDGRAVFALSFTKEDIGKTYSYQLSESNLGIKGMTYDTDVHELTISLSLDESNQLTADLTMDGNSVDSLSATFENTYDADKPSTPPTGDKSNLMTWFVLMMISGSALVALIVYDRKLRKI